MIQEARIIPFTNGMQFRAWDIQNCQRCGKQPYEVVERTMEETGQWLTSGCDLFDTIFCGEWGNGSIDEDIARRIGYCEAYTWDCPERTALSLSSEEAPP